MNIKTHKMRKLQIYEKKFMNNETPKNQNCFKEGAKIRARCTEHPYLKNISETNTKVFRLKITLLRIGLKVSP